ncbi:hypothetical protein L3Y34_005399 [Caenorhabditis briggsae]|uniref:Uncharacterized protein n=1 Tax=Caenorhabditis briggsae TaxID=6238 RepID=A0AAE9AC05_CAEBR|nr:hypothetical protein L3Y34_005399 [Caenorhabditis briggsae]
MRTTKFSCIEKSAKKHRICVNLKNPILISQFSALDTVHNVAETGTGAVQGAVDGALPAVGGAVQSVGGVVQGVAGMVPELPIGGAPQPS